MTGMGCVSALGEGLGATLRALRKGEDPSREPTFFSIEGCLGRRAAELSDPEVRSVLARYPEAQRWHRVTRMLMCAMDEALEGAEGFSPQRAIFGTTSGGMSCGESFFRAVKGGGDAKEHRREAREYPPQQAANQVLRSKGWSVSPVIVSNACASGSNAIGLAWELVSSGRAARVVCGGYDALAQLVFCGFDALKALSPDRCRPFDAGRSGLVLGEGAAVFFLESAASAEEGGRVPLAEVCGYGSVTDNHHLTQPEPGGSGPRGAMRAALGVCGVEADAIDYVNAHGTGTRLNDASEGCALAEVLPRAWVSSTKGMSGHALGAAGAIEAAFCILAMREGFYPGSVNLECADPEWPLRLVPPEGIQDSGPGVVLSNSFGFGGSNASLIFRRVEK